MTAGSGRKFTGKYAALRLWEYEIGAHGYYIDARAKEAERQGQPDDVLFERWANDGTGGTGEWVRVSDLDPDHIFRRKLEKSGIAA